MIHLTYHAVERAMQRFSWDKDKLYEKALSSLSEGIFVLHDEVLREIFLVNCQYKGGLPYAYEGVVFVFDEDRLITVYPITGHGTVRS